MEREEFGVETEEEDSEILIARMEMVADTVTLARYTEKEYGQLKEEIQRGHISQDSAKLIGMKECFLELCVNEGVVLRGERLLVPTKLRSAVLAAAHEGCPGRDAMLRQIRQAVWWSGIDKDVKAYTGSCLGC